MNNKFRYVNEIKFKDRTYAIFDNDGYKVFLRKLETDDFGESVDLGNSIKSTKLVYTDIDEFKELNKIFNHKLKLINSIIEENNAEENTFEDNLEIVLEKGKIYRFPVKIYDNGEFISLAQAIEETGFGIAPRDSNNNLEDATEETYENEEELFSSKKIEVEKLENGEYRIKSIKENPKYEDSIFIENNQEFSQISGIENPTYDDLREAITNNENVGDRFKDILIEGINKLEENNFDIDYSVLFYNLKRLDIDEVDTETFVESGNVIANFNPADGKVTIKHEDWDELSSEELLKKKYMILHEVLGHGTTEAYVENNFKSIVYSLVTPIENSDGMLATVDMINYGDAFREATADLIALNAIDSDKDKEIIAYKPFFMELEILLRVLDFKARDFIDGGIWGLKDEMKKNGIANPEKYIDSADTAKMSVTIGFCFSEKSDLQGDIIEMLNQIIDNKISEGCSREDAILNLVSILDNEITLDYEDEFENFISPISIANIKKGIINELEEKA